PFWPALPKFDPASRGLAELPQKPLAQLLAVHVLGVRRVIHPGPHDRTDELRPRDLLLQVLDLARYALAPTVHLGFTVPLANRFHSLSVFMMACRSCRAWAGTRT